VQKALLHGIELGNEYYADKDTPKEVVEAYGIEQNGKLREITDPGELARRRDTRPFEEQRDFFTLNRIWDWLSRSQSLHKSGYPHPVDKTILLHFSCIPESPREDHSRAPSTASKKQITGLTS
jgi:hypothetical protein